MAVSAARVSVDTTATEIATGNITPGGKSTLIKNADASASVYLGGSAVTSSDGYELAAGGTVSVDLDAGEKIYGITASGTVSVHTLSIGA